MSNRAINAGPGFRAQRTYQGATRRAVRHSGYGGSVRTGRKNCGGCGKNPATKTAGSPPASFASTKRISNTETKPEAEIAEAEVVATGSGWYRDADGNTYHGKDAIPDHLTLTEDV